MIMAVRPVIVRLSLWRCITSEIFLGRNDFSMNSGQFVTFDAFVRPVRNGVIPKRVRTCWKSYKYDLPKPFFHRIVGFLNLVHGIGNESANFFEKTA